MEDLLADYVFIEVINGKIFMLDHLKYISLQKLYNTIHRNKK